MSPHLATTDGPRSPGVRLLHCNHVSRPAVAADGGARIVRVIGGRDGGGRRTQRTRVVRQQARSIGTRAGIRIVGGAERAVPAPSIRVIGGQEAR